MKFFEGNSGQFLDGYDQYRYDSESVYIWRYPKTRIDCRESFAAKLKNAKFAKVDTYITRQDFLFANRKVCTANLVLVQFMWNRFENEWALEEMKGIGLAPARIEHLFAFQMIAAKEPSDFHANFFTQSCGSTTCWWGNKPAAAGIETWQGGMDQTAELTLLWIRSSNTSRVRLLFTAHDDWQVPTN